MTVTAANVLRPFRDALLRTGINPGLRRGALEDGEESWWSAWRRRLRNPYGHVHTRALLRTVQEPAKKRRKKRKSVVLSRENLFGSIDS